MDVAITFKGGDPTDERAYVVNRVEKTVTPIRLSVSPPEPRPPIDLFGQFPVAIAARSDGKRLYTMNETGGTISVINTTLTVVDATRSR